MVPLKVHFGDEMFRDGVDMTYKEFFAKLEGFRGAPHDVAAHQVGEFTAVYERALGSATSACSRCTSPAR